MNKFDALELFIKVLGHVGERYYQVRFLFLGSDIYYGVGALIS